MAYLFTHFIGEQPQGEQIYFSLSKDGLHWKDLNDGKPILYSETGMKGVRDPFVVRDPKNHRFFLIATDLRIEVGVLQMAEDGMLQLKLEAKIWLLWSRRISFIGVSRY